MFSAVPLICCLASGAAVVAQEVRASAGPDPYTHGEPGALAALGYERFAPFPLGVDHDTTKVEALLGTEPLIWIETRHFRLGCALPGLRVNAAGPSGKQWQRDVTRELEQLHERLPSIKATTRTLDPWLRAHLFAQRLERLYDEVAEHLGFAERDSDELRSKVLGAGEHLGMREKHVVLLLRSQASHARYTAAYHGEESLDPMRYLDRDFECLYWGASEETAEGLLRDDHAMHAHLAFNVAHNLYAGCDGCRRNLPAWLVTGLGHWHSRRVARRFPTFDRVDGDDRQPQTAFWEWEKRVTGMARKGALLPLADLLDLPRAGEFDLENHIQCWAVVDRLIAERKPQLFRFVLLAKQSGTFQREAFEAAFGEPVAAADEALRTRLRSGAAGRAR